MKSKVQREMKPILKYIAVPLSIIFFLGAAAKLVWDFSPLIALSSIGIALATALAFGYSVRRKDLKRGWRVGYQGRDEMFYEERIEGKWQRITIDGAMLCGKAHHVIYLPTQEQWQAMPQWTQDRQDDIIARVKQAFAPPGYECQPPEQASVATSAPPKI